MKLFLKILLSLFLLLTLFVGCAVIYFWPPDVKSLDTFNPARTRLMEIRTIQAKAAGKPYKIRQTWVPLNRISLHLRHAVLVSEDANFYQHHGIDWAALQYSVEQDIQRKKFAFGGSTITQQVAKNVFLTPRKSPFRKLKEIEIAVFMEEYLSKKRILEIYLNVVEWGDGIFGAEAASRHYFGKSAADLTPEEAASLAAVLPSPRRYSPVSGSRYISRRTDWILKWMDRSGFLPQPELPVDVPIFTPSTELLNEQGTHEIYREDNDDESVPANVEGSQPDESAAPTEIPQRARRSAAPAQNDMNYTGLPSWTSRPQVPAQPTESPQKPSTSPAPIETPQAQWTQ